jgi:type II secretory ATPase GspE/PulE/Tfp pilus assembly ATPase PilB-like protein
MHHESPQTASVPLTGAASVLHREELIAAVDAQARKPVQRLGDTLVTLGFITTEDLDSALALQHRDNSMPVGELLIQQGRISRTQLDMALNTKLGYAVIDAERFPLEPNALHKVSMATLLRLNALPLVLHDGQLIVALADPKRQDDMDELAWASECWIRPVMADAVAIRQRLQSIVSGQDVSGVSANRPGAGAEQADRWLASVEQQMADNEPGEDATLAEENENALVKLINSMIIDARSQGASDIHIETHPGRDKVRIRFRRDGRLRPYMELPYTLRSALVARIKIMCSLDISERRKPQDGKINFARYSPDHPLELRVVTIPTLQGLEDVVLRLLTAAEPLPLDKLGIHPRNLQRFKAAVERPYGLILCAGPTGSGKTTTLHSALSHINTPDRKIWTAEDPIEITQAGLRQVQINPRIDWTFEKALRSFLRADPDVIMVGEVRDRETARMAVEAALTGHLVLSTIHTNSAPETVTRLLDMGMDPFNFGDSLLAVMGQRLVRRYCMKCREHRPATSSEIEELLGDYLHAGHLSGSEHEAAIHADWMSRFAHDGRLMKWHAPGCKQCDDSGMRGRVGLHELLVVSREIRRMIQMREPVAALQACAREQGMLTLRQDGIEKVMQGVTSIDEVRATSNS